MFKFGKKAKNAAELKRNLDLPERCLKCPLVKACIVEYVPLKVLDDRLSKIGSKITNLQAMMKEVSIPGVNPDVLTNVDDTAEAVEFMGGRLMTFSEQPWKAVQQLAATAEDACEGRRFDQAYILNVPMKCTNLKVPDIRQHTYPLPAAGWYYGARPEELVLRISE